MASPAVWLGAAEVLTRGGRKKRRRSFGDDDAIDALDALAAARLLLVLSGILIAFALDIGAVAPDGLREERATGVVTREEQDLAQRGIGAGKSWESVRSRKVISPFE